MEQTVDNACDSKIAWCLLTSVKIVCANETPVQDQASNTNTPPVALFFYETVLDFRLLDLPNLKNT